MQQPDKHTLELARSLLKYCDIDPAGLEDENKVLLSINYDITVFMIVENRLVHFLCILGNAIDSGTFYRNLLHANFLSCTGAEYSYSIEPESGELLMSLTLQSDELDADAFIGKFEDFVRYCEQWTASLETRNENVPDKPDNAATGTSAHRVEAGDAEHFPQAHVFNKV